MLMQIRSTFVFLNLVWNLAFVRCPDNLQPPVCVCVFACPDYCLPGPVCDNNCVENNNESLRRRRTVSLYLCPGPVLSCLRRGLILPHPYMFEQFGRRWSITYLHFTFFSPLYCNESNFCVCRMQIVMHPSFHEQQIRADISKSHKVPLICLL